MSDESMTKNDVPATRGDLRKLEAALDSKLDSKLDTTVFESSIAAVERRLGAELAQHANAIMEANRSSMRALLDPYVSLPARVEKLEAAMFAPKPKRRRAAR